MIIILKFYTISIKFYDVNDISGYLLITLKFPTKEFVEPLFSMFKINDSFLHIEID